MAGALEVVLELTRGKSSAVDEAHPLGDSEYLLRHGDGVEQSARFPWSEAFHADLQAIQGLRPDPQAFERVGNVLRGLLDELGWPVVEAEVVRALEAKPPREVRVTVRTMAGELCRLPLEVLTLRPSGLALGRTAGCHVQWEWPDSRSAPEAAAAPEEDGGTLLFAWSTAGGGLDAGAHRRAIQQAGKRHGYPERALVEVADASLKALREALDGVRAQGKTVAVLHLLCHGGQLPGTGGGYGLSLNGAEVVDPATFAAALQPYAGMVRSVVLCACEGANLGDASNVLGSAAQRLHRVGFPAVVGSRVALSDRGARAFTAAFHEAVLAGEPFHRAVAAGRRELGTGEAPHEWSAIQAYARASDGEQYPVVFPPYRGLRPFEAKHRRFFFGREALAKELVDRVLEASRGERPRFQVVAGTSGSGKSSLVKAGLVPALPATWKVVSLRPGGDGEEPEQGLALLARRLRAARGAAAESEVASDGAAVLAEAQRLEEERPGPLLLEVDQLEESFRLPGDEPRRFLGCLWELAKQEALDIVVVSTFRADLVERAQDMVLGDGITLQATVYREAYRLYVENMGRDELLEVIQRPLEAVGLSFESGVAEQLRDEAGKEPGALPLLEHALDTLWRAREGKVLTRAAYQRLGLSGALSRRLDVLWDTLPVEQRRQGERLLVELVDSAEDVKLSTRRRRKLDEVRPTRRARAAAFDAVLEKLVTEQRLVVRGREESAAGGSGWAEIAHEALIRRWPRLQGWLQAERERVQREKLRRAVFIAAGLAVSFVGVLALAVFAYTANRRAQDAITQALEVANAVIFTADRELEPIAGAGPVRRKLLEQVGKLQDKLQTASQSNEGARTRAANHIQRGNVALSHDDLKTARREYEAAFSIIEAIAQADPSNAQLQRDLSVSYDRLGDVARDGGDLQAARDFFSKSLAIFEAIAKADPSNAQLQRDLSVSYNKLGDVARDGGDLQAARDFFSKSLAVREALAQADPSNAQLQRDLSVSYNKLGDVAREGGDLQAARDFFSKSLAIREALAKADPSNAQLQRDLSVSYERMAVLNVLEKGAIGTSRDWLRRALRLRREVVTRDSENAEAALELARTAHLAAWVELSTGSRKEAMAHAAEAHATLNRLVHLGIPREHPAIRQLTAALDDLK
jgi:tetratricopeptide (TPR) repeat protein